MSSLAFSVSHFGPFDAPYLGAGVGREVVRGWLGGPGQCCPCHPLDDHGATVSAGTDTAPTSKGVGESHAVRAAVSYCANNDRARCADSVCAPRSRQ